jgi:hypothetical protein
MRLKCLSVPLNEHRDIGACNLGYEVSQVPHRRTVTNHCWAMPGTMTAAKPLFLGLQLVLFDCALDHQLEFIEVDRFHQIVSGPQLHGLHRLIDTAKRREHDDGSRRCDLGQWPKTLGVRQVDVEQNQTP